MSDWQRFLAPRPGSSRPRFSASSRQFMPDVPAELFESTQPDDPHRVGVVAELADENDALKSKVVDLEVAMSRMYHQLADYEAALGVKSTAPLLEHSRRWRSVVEQVVPAAKRDYEAAQAGDSRDPLEKYLAPRPA